MVVNKVPFSRYLNQSELSLQILQPLFSVNDAAALESAGVIIFTVTRSGDTTAAVNVAYMTMGGTAVAGTDYETASGVVTFEAGESTQTILVTINDNMLNAASNLQFVVTLSDPSGGFLEDASGTGTIIDDEGVSECPAVLKPSG